MKIVTKIRNNLLYQFLVGICLIIAIAIPFFLLDKYFGFRVVALILLLVVSIIAMLFDIIPVLGTAIFSALLWNFFFIPPLYKFTIGTPEDVLLFMMYFAIALINTVLSSKIKKADLELKEKSAREKSIKLYNTVINSLSHELRTPIATIIGAVDTLKETRTILSPSDEKDLLSEINIASFRLNRQVENLLNMSRIESGFIKPKLDWCDINELVHIVIQTINIDYVKRNIIFISDENLPLIKVDGGLIEQVLHNLIHNAIHYTPDESKIKITVEYEDPDCLITIEDSGPGFPESEIKRAFDKFFRLPNSVSGGTGIGLSIVKGFIEAHNGKVTLENVKNGHGAIFNISIPVQVSPLNEIDRYHA